MHVVLHHHLSVSHFFSLPHSVGKKKCEKERGESKSERAKEVMRERAESRRGREGGIGLTDVQRPIKLCDKTLSN